MKYLLPILLLIGCAAQNQPAPIIVQSPHLIKVECYDKNNKLLSSNNYGPDAVIVANFKGKDESEYCLISQI